MAVDGDTEVSSDGRTLVWSDDPGVEWCQRAQDAAAFTVGTSRYDSRVGFPSVDRLHDATAPEVAALVKYFLLGRSGTAEVSNVKVDLDGRDATVSARARLNSGQVVNLNLI